MVYTSIYTQIIPDHDNNFDHTTLWEKSVTIYGIKNKSAKQEKSHPDEVCDQNIVSGGESLSMINISKTKNIFFYIWILKRSRAVPQRYTWNNIKRAEWRM